MIELTLELLITHLGQPIKKVGDEYFWKCPQCIDTHKDNLKFNHRKGVLYCFANSDHSKMLLKEIKFNAKSSQIQRKFDEKVIKNKAISKQKQSKFDEKVVKNLKNENPCGSAVYKNSFTANSQQNHSNFNEKVIKNSKNENPLESGVSENFFIAKS